MENSTSTVPQESIQETQQPIQSPKTSNPISKLILIIGALLLITLIAEGSYLLGRKTSPQSQQISVQQTIKPTSSPATDPTANWKTYSENFDWLKKSISVKYPPNWTVVKSTHSGHPNWITINAPAQNQCINISLSSEGKDTTLDDELKNAASQWSSELDNKVISNSSLTINGQPAKTRSVSRNGNNFMDAVVYIGTDPRTSGYALTNTGKVFVILSSCGTSEKDIFNAVFMSISSTP